MSDKRLKIDTNHKEIKSFGTAMFPVRLGKETIQNYWKQRFLAHWHHALELTYVLEGRMRYRVNDTACALQAGEVLFVNSEVIHQGEAIGKENCAYYALTFMPEMMAPPNSLIYQKYIYPIVANKRLSHILFSGTEADSCFKRLKIIEAAFARNQPLSEWSIFTNLLDQWRIITQYAQGHSYVVHVSRDAQLIRKMITFIQQHFPDPICLAQIADVAHVAKSTCIRIFKSTTAETPIDYLNHYRIQKAQQYLLDTTASISSIASRTGFNSFSYFGLLFKRKVGMTPRQFRKVQLSADRCKSFPAGKKS
ncbi:MAG: AraC family transcriptional regulator [Sporolactobacillus sp.]|nr:AraC family transcriptional regulator [Sporolactobacillus sp.]